MLHSNIASFICVIPVYFFQAVYSRVARVCKKDLGGAHKFRHKWTTFLKSRLNCSVPGDIPFYFDEIQSTSSVVGGDSVFYAVFNTPENSIAGSAVCSFKMDDVVRTFAESPFKHQE
jgi:semaphorin 6